MTSLTLHTVQGETQSLAIILLCDYLKVNLTIKTCTKSCEFKKSNTHAFPLLETASGDLIETGSAILRYVVRTSSCQSLYNETSDCVGSVDQNLDLLNFDLFRSLAVLQHSERQSETVDKVKLASAKANIIATLKSLNVTYENCTSELNLADFVLFVFLGSVLNADVKKALKGFKNLKSRWETVSKVEQFESLLRPYANRAFN